VTRVAITTTGESFRRVAAEFSGTGLEPVSLPCIRIEPADDSEIELMRRSVESADLLVVTSRRTIDILWPNGGMPPIPVAAVGTATSHAAADAGGELICVGTGGGAELVELLVPRLRNAVVAYPHARRADPQMLDLLRSHAVAVHGAALYDTIPVAPPADPVDAVAFASPSAVEGWASSRTFDPLVMAIGPTTTAALERIGRTPDLVADDPTFAALARAIAHHFRSTA
jgi:uroporphyrinogen-III synthase